MLVALTINKLSKIHRKPSGDMSPFKNAYAKLDANVCGSGINAELRMTCRGRPSILGPRQLTHKQTGFWHSGMPALRPCDPSNVVASPAGPSCLCWTWTYSLL